MTGIPFSEIFFAFERESSMNTSNFNSCANTLSKIIMINPDEENLYRQKAVLYLRRVKALLK